MNFISPILAILFSAVACIAQTATVTLAPPIKVKVSVVDKSGKPVTNAQAGLEFDKGILFQKGTFADGGFTFEKPDKSSATLYVAAPGYLGSVSKIQGESVVSITLTDSKDKDSQLIYERASLKDKGGEIIPMGGMYMYANGIVLLQGGKPVSGAAYFSLNQPISAASSDGKKFKIYVRELTPHVCLVEYTR